MAADLKSKARSVLVTEADEACGFSGRGGRTRASASSMRICDPTSGPACSPRRPSSGRPGTLRRPVSVLAITDHAGRSEAVELVNQVARDIGAGVVHLDASSLGRRRRRLSWPDVLLGPRRHLDARLHGRGEEWAGCPARPARRRRRAGAGNDLRARVQVAALEAARFAARLIGEFHSSETDDKWDGLKMNHILEEIVGACDSKSPAEPLIVHVHNYVELSLTHEGSQILNRLRGIVDRMRQRGRQAVLVGSVASRWESAEMRQKAEELSLGCHFIPYRHSDRTASLLRERKDTGVDNLRNVRAMLSALAGRPMQLDAAGWDRHPDLQQFLSRTLYDIDAVYRVATGHARPRPPSGQSGGCLRRAGSASGRPPDACPRGVVAGQQHGRRGPAVAACDCRAGPAALRQPAGRPWRRHARVQRAREEAAVGARGRQEHQDGLRRHRVSAETKESLRALTSLSLIRPEAFLYGVLATERIPGCLLYGPPGTGQGR